MFKTLFDINNELNCFFVCSTVIAITIILGITIVNLQPSVPATPQAQIIKQCSIAFTGSKEEKLNCIKEFIIEDDKDGERGISTKK